MSFNTRTVQYSHVLMYGEVFKDLEKFRKFWTKAYIGLRDGHPRWLDGASCNGAANNNSRKYHTVVAVLPNDQLFTDQNKSFEILYIITKEISYCCTFLKTKIIIVSPSFRHRFYESAHFLNSMQSSHARSLR